MGLLLGATHGAIHLGGSRGCSIAMARDKTPDSKYFPIMLTVLPRQFKYYPMSHEGKWPHEENLTLHKTCHAVVQE